MNLLDFPVTIYGNLEKYNEVLTKARCRIFYKYANRNGTYITDEFADKLLSSVRYVPVKGIFNDGDYSDHGVSRDEGRIYGIVPENPNLAWESFTDDDGVTREYACVDVLIFTALYEEARDIVGKSQSMELYAPSLKYHDAMIQNHRYIVFDEGCFLGLQVLGDKVEPCFEGASFYTLQQNIEAVISQLKKYGGLQMPKFNFKLSDSDKFEALWQLLNPLFNEENGWVVSYGISQVYDDYALAINYEDNSWVRAYYQKNDETDMVEITELVKCYVLDVTESEKQTLDTLRRLNGDTYELVSDVLLQAQDNFELASKIEEYNDTISTLSSEKESALGEVNSLNENLAAANATITSLNEKIEALETYKHNIETAQKMAVIEEYVAQLSDEIVEKYRNDLDNYTCDELDMHLAYELKKANPNVYTKSSSDFVPKQIPEEGIAAVLSKYKK